MFTVRTVLRAAATTGALICALVAVPLPSAATPPYAMHCADYPNRAAAQADFVAHGGSPTFNWHGMDNDHDGQACEHHRYPGQPTPPPNPGPSGCAVCSPTPAPSPSTAPSPSPSVVPSPSCPPTPTGTPATSPVPSTVPVLPVTGPARPGPALAWAGAGVLLAGTALIAGSLRRRRP